jgi:hypothetical protein
MIVDTQDDLVPAENEKEQVVDINPDSLENDADPQDNVILATDRAYTPARRRPHGLLLVYMLGRELICE